jgi:hypothetical protein
VENRPDPTANFHPGADARQPGPRRRCVHVEKTQHRFQEVANLTNSVVILNLVILAAVLMTDTGVRRFTVRRVVRPLLVTAIIVPFFLQGPAAGGAGLALEFTGAAAGIVLGLIASRLMDVARDAHIGAVLTIAGAPYVYFWTALVGARLALAYGMENVFPGAVGHWLAVNQISVAALTDTFIVFSIAVVLTRAAVVIVRAQRLHGAAREPVDRAAVQAGDLDISAVIERYRHQTNTQGNLP